MNFGVKLDVKNSEIILPVTLCRHETSFPRRGGPGLNRELSFSAVTSESRSPGRPAGSAQVIQTDSAETDGDPEYQR